MLAPPSTASVYFSPIIRWYRGGMGLSAFQGLSIEYTHQRISYGLSHYPSRLWRYDRRGDSKNSRRYRSLQSRNMQSIKHHSFPVPPAGTDRFYRAINPEYDKGDGTVSSAAFCNDSDGLAMSSNWGHMSTPESTAREWPRWSGPDQKVASVLAETYWSHGQVLRFTPILPDRPAHSDIEGKKTKSLRRKCARSATVFHTPT